MLAITAVLGAGFGLGLAAVINGFLRTEAPVAASTRPFGTVLAVRTARATLSRQTLTRAGIALGCAALVGALTGWPVGAVLAALAAYVLPVTLGADRHASAALARTEAVAVWTEMLRDSLSAAAGLEQTILLTAPFAPEPIAGEVDDLATSLRMGRRLTVALEEFGRRIDDPGGRLVARALLQASRRQSRQLPDLLSELARRSREQANLHLRLAPGRAKVRTNARIIVVFTLALAAGMVLFNRSFLAPYDSALGQLVLVGVAVIFGAGFLWLTKLSQIGHSTRPPDDVPQEARSQDATETQMTVSVTMPVTRYGGQR